MTEEPTGSTEPSGSASSGDPEIDRLLAEAQRAYGEDRWADAEGALREVADRFAGHGDVAGEVRTRVQVAVLQASTGRVDAGLAAIDGCLSSAEDLGEDALVVEVQGTAANLLLAAGRPAPAVDRFTTGLDRAARLDDPRWQVQLRTGLGLALFQTGEAESSAEVLHDNARFARSVSDAVTAGMALETVSEAMASVQRPDDALGVALEALAKFEEAKAGPFVIQASISVSNLFLVTGHPEQAAEYTTQAVALGRTFGGPEGESSVLLGLAMTAGQRGDLTSARRFAARSRACLSDAGLPEPPELTALFAQLDGSEPDPDRSAPDDT